MIFVFEDYSLDTDRRELRRGTDLVAVEPQVFDLLQYLISNRERVVSRDDLIAAVWGGRIVSESTISSRVTAVRQAIGDSGEEQRLIRTIPRRGLRFVAEAREEQRSGDAGHAMPAAERERDEPTSPSPPGSPSVERRQLTVMVCDVIGSVALSGHLDPEDLCEVMAVCHERLTEVVEHYGGFVARYTADGVLVYFGYPQAHEDDAERAVRAGLALTRGVAELKIERLAKPLQPRVSIATGLVVVGDKIGVGLTADYTIVGEAPHLAAHLLALADPGAVVISAGTRRVTSRLFEYADIGPVELRGVGKPITAPRILREGTIAGAWRVIGESSAEGRFEALHGEHLTPLVGREHELGILLERWAWAKDGDGQVVLLSGEPGIGKSRIMRELRARLGDEPHIRLLYQCSPHHTTSPLHPLIAQLEHAAGFARDDSPGARLRKLEALLARGTDRLDQAAPLIAALLDLPADSRSSVPDLTPQRRKQLTLEALLDQLEGLTAAQPVLLVYEDVHWIDPTTQELLSLAIERIRQLPVLALITFRPEFQPPWTGQAHVTTLTMSRLGRHQGADLVVRVTGAKPLPAAMVEHIVARTDGVPLFVEELTKTVLESGLLRDAGDHYALSGPLAPLAIPATLHDSLMARLDRLAPVKEVAQLGAVIGREFSHDLLAAVSPLSEADLASALGQLVTSELVFRRGVPPDAIYTFKHTLVQDAAYQSLLNSKRQQLHARIAEALEQQFPDAAEVGPEVLARHFNEANLLERAIPYWRRAGELAAGRSANVEAIAYLSKGLELIGTLPDTSGQIDEELTLLLAIGGPLIATNGYAASEVEQTYSRAWGLCEQLGRSAELFPVLRGLWNYHLVRGELQRAHDHSARLLALADEQGAPVHRALARRTLGTTLFYLGRFADATAALDEGIAIDDAVAAWEDPAHLLLYTERAGVVCRLLSGRALWFLGFPDRALERVEAGLVLAQHLAHANSLAFALTWAAFLQDFRREFAAAHRRAEAAIALAREHHMSQWLAQATMCRGFALVGLGQHVEGIAQLRASLAAWNDIGAHVLDTQWLGFLAEAHLQAGEFEDALTALDRAAETTAATGECNYQAELNRLRGVVLAKTGEDAEAITWLRQAIDTARSQQAKSLELRAATSLARLWAEQGERPKAHDLLAPVYGWFTEGFDTADLKDAKALLDELR